ncbi:aldehyde dehydrogenase family protein [Kordiimonas sp.]|uniref:aldehyde dehydrogenase family protein n=1 Tax=Kordiimonas sp. TaxID=1970157 RepID=UPI003A9054FB
MTDIQWQRRAEAADLSIRNFISGEARAVSASSDTLIEKHSPRDGSLLYRFPEGSSADVDAAVASARSAFEDGRWSKLPLYQRAAVLNKLADLLEEHKERFALYESLDVGKPIMSALGSDIPLSASYLRSAATNAGLVMGPSGADQGHFAYMRRKPVGVVAGIAGWNFPLALATSKLAPALIMGNCLVLKPSEFTSLSAQHLAALAIEAGMPAGVLNVVHGAGHTVGDALANHQDVDLLSFVGSSATGKRIMQSAGASNMKRLILECGGKSPYLVFDDCPEDLEAVAADIVSKAFPNQGALCVAGTRLLVQESMRDKLLPLVIEKAKAIRAADPLDADTRFGALVNEAHMNKVLGYIESGLEEGAELLLGGKRVTPGEDALAGGFYIEPTIFDGVKADARIAREEIFGPVLAVMTFKDEAEAIQLANASSFGLAAYAATTDLGRAQRLGEAINAGNLLVTGNPRPIGGWVNLPADKHRESGFGYSGGLEGLAAYTTSTTVRLLT